MVEKITCKTCIYWRGRTDINKCKLLLDFIPEWWNPKCSYYKKDETLNEYGLKK